MSKEVVMSCSNPIQLMEQSNSVHNRIKMFLLEDELDFGVLASFLYVCMIFFILESDALANVCRWNKAASQQTLFNHWWFNIGQDSLSSPLQNSSSLTRNSSQKLWKMEKTSVQSDIFIFINLSFSENEIWYGRRYQSRNCRCFVFL